MCAKLLILESPGKVKKVQEILGSGWKVAASVGHVRDLPVKEIGVTAPDFKPKYVPTDRGKDVLSRLTGLVKNAEAVYLATDPDREGEAIPWLPRRKDGGFWIVSAVTWFPARSPMLPAKNCLPAECKARLCVWLWSANGKYRISAAQPTTARS